MPLHANNYDDAEDYLDDVYRPEDNEDLEYNELSAREQQNVLKDMFFKGTKTPEQSAKDMRSGLRRPSGLGTGIINLRGHIHHIMRDRLGRILKWLD